MPMQINECFLRFSRRADQVSREKLVSTFVNAEPLLTILSTEDHQVVYGRRGTGKTHAFLYLAQLATDNGEFPIYVDLRSTGSSGSIYNDPTKSIPERATSLLLDVLETLHDKLLEICIEKAEELDLSRTGPLLDAFSSSIGDVTIIGEM